jgi:hypothetical protein
VSDTPSPLTDQQLATEIVERIKHHRGMSRYQFVREVFDKFMKLEFQNYVSVRRSAPLNLLVLDDMLKICVGEKDYREFVILMTKRLMESPEKFDVNLGMDIEYCLREIAAYPSDRQSNDFFDFCNNFAMALRPLIMFISDEISESDVVRPVMSQILLPLQDGNSSSLGMDAIRNSVAEILFESAVPYRTAYQVGLSTCGLRLTDFIEFLKIVRRKDATFFRVVLEAYLTNPKKESASQDIIDVEAATKRPSFFSLAYSRFCAVGSSLRR